MDFGRRGPCAQRERKPEQQQHQPMHSQHTAKHLSHFHHTNVVPPKGLGIMVPSLPEEILVSIFSNLSAGEQVDYQSLFNLCLASWAFKRITEPLLYYTFQRTGPNRIKRTRLFLRTIIQNPRLGSLVSHIHLSEPWDFRRGVERSDAPHDPPSHDQIALYTEDVLRPCLTTEVTYRQFHKDLYYGYEDIEITLLLSLCHNVAHLDFPMLTAGKHYLKYVLQAHWNTYRYGPKTTFPIERRIFSKLTSLYARPMASDYTWLSARLLVFFYLPHLQTLVGTFCNFTEFGYGAISSTNLTQVKFEDSDWNLDGVAELLKVCPKLEVFELHAGGPYGCTTNYIGFGEALRRHGTSIRFLLIHPPMAFLKESTEGQVNTLGNLKPLKQLLCLDVPLEILGEQRKIELDLTTFNAENQRYLDGLVARLGLNFPVSLKTLKVPGYLDLDLHDNEKPSWKGVSVLWSCNKGQKCLK